MASKLELVFPTFIYRASLPLAKARRLNKDLKKEIQILEKIDSEGRKWSSSRYTFGYSSYSSQDRLHQTSPNFSELSDLIQPHLKNFVRGLKWDLRRRKLKMTTCWANAMGFGTHHTMHIHPLSVISGVYYVHVPKNSSPLKFEDPRLGFFMAAPARDPSAPARYQPYFSVQPKAGDLLLFESWLRHEVPPHRSHQRRYSISFNIE